MQRSYVYLGNSQHSEMCLPMLMPWGQLRNEHYMLTCISVSVYATYKELCAGSRYQGHGQVFTSPRYCGMYLLVLTTLDPCPHLMILQKYTLKLDHCQDLQSSFVSWCTHNEIIIMLFCYFQHLHLFICKQICPSSGISGDTEIIKFPFYILIFYEFRVACFVIA